MQWFASASQYSIQYKLFGNHINKLKFGIEGIASSIISTQLLLPPQEKSIFKITTLETKKNSQQHLKNPQEILFKMVKSSSNLFASKVNLKIGKMRIHYFFTPTLKIEEFLKNFNINFTISQGSFS